MYEIKLVFQHQNYYAVKKKHTSYWFYPKMPRKIKFT